MSHDFDNNFFKDVLKLVNTVNDGVDRLKQSNEKEMSKIPKEEQRKILQMEKDLEGKDLNEIANELQVALKNLKENNNAS